MELDEVVELTRALIRVPSVNPMGRPLTGPEFGERRLSEFLTAWAAERHLEVVRQRLDEGRENLVLVIPGDDRHCLLWEVHQDTVPVDTMTIDPFGGELRDGRVWGRGACDVKGPMAAMLVAARRRAEAPRPGVPTLLVALAVDEEAGGAGAALLPNLWRPGGPLPRPVAAVVAEPTELDCVVAHKGVLRWRCHALGRAAHSSRWERGDNALYRMARVLLELERYHLEELQSRPAHPLLGRPSLSVGRIEGGMSVNIVPDQCVIEIDRRLMPEESPTDVWREVQQRLARAGLGEHLRHDEPFTASIGLADRGNERLAAAVVEASRSAGGRGERIGVPFGTDAARLCPHIPCVVFGPGSIAQAHTDDEWIDVEALRQAVGALLALAHDWRADETGGG